MVGCWQRTRTTISRLIFCLYLSSCSFVLIICLITLAATFSPVLSFSAKYTIPNVPEFIWLITRYSLISISNHCCNINFDLDIVMIYNRNHHLGIKFYIKQRLLRKLHGYQNLNSILWIESVNAFQNDQ